MIPFQESYFQLQVPNRINFIASLFNYEYNYLYGDDSAYATGLNFLPQSPLPVILLFLLVGRIEPLS